MLMRARVVVQGATVALMVGTAFYDDGNLWKSSKLILIPLNHDAYSRTFS
ncbi:hypothetical protein SLEP1_g25181 [Rubroshorea leprosula]|uniref:Uncharacterized protein n=1 Tax=Rubroshorea leprosula TaxID=152421 RepID=A0AAV5JP97_9ROSI|nr:hypothetical protein SLEP1_g25181 [Rubroshorea leprosula]